MQADEREEEEEGGFPLSPADMHLLEAARGALRRFG